MRCAPVSYGPRQPDFFKARSRTLIPSWPGSLHLAKYECTVRHLGKSLGKNRHWQPVRNRYNTAQKTSYKSTVVGLVRLRTLCSRGGADLFELLSADIAGVFFPHAGILDSQG